jgi:NADPH:quinone reductase-like Zn-dependent oxidoreductase
VTSRHAAKLERAKTLGANFTVLDTGADWSREVRKATGGRGVDIVAESVGKAVHLPCIKSLARGGTLVTCGCTTGADGTTDLARIFWNQLSIMGSTMGSMDEFRSVVALLQSGALRATWIRSLSQLRPKRRMRAWRPANSLESWSLSGK